LAVTSKAITPDWFYFLMISADIPATMTFAGDVPLRIKILKSSPTFLFKKCKTSHLHLFFQEDGVFDRKYMFI
jgi:hypothetical protein